MLDPVNAAVNIRDRAWERRQGQSPKDGQRVGNTRTKPDRWPQKGLSRTHTARSAAPAVNPAI